ncbi:MAG: MFS transporter [Cytophagales bacterium]|nr:MFS transporter [Bernardetiaceae bacterium]MDW8211407.1 MFS transporter [Cytophagales bacterium]
MHSNTIRPGLRQNLGQFILLVIINAFVGSMVGIERTIFPQFAALHFQISSQTAMLSFIAAFGISKAITNYFAGRLANQWGRRNLLILGWVLALPVPAMLITANQWMQVVLANLLLGVSQGLTWSSTVVMKIDLVGEKNRGLAMGLNEFAGYLAIGVMAYLTGYIATVYGVAPYPFYLGIGVAIVGLLLTFLTKDTGIFVAYQTKESKSAFISNVFWQTTWQNSNLSAITQAGLVNNLNDGMIWGLLPALLMQHRYSEQTAGIITGIYPTVWGIGQLFTGRMADKYSKKSMIFWGMLLQGVAIVLLPFDDAFYWIGLLAAILGIGTALVYPTFLAAIAEAAHPAQCAESIGVFRFWRDSGYVFGALVSGIVADLLGIPFAIAMVGFITILSAVGVQFRMSSHRGSS